MSVTATSVLGQAGQELGAFIPRLIGALALLLIGLLIARLIARLLLRGRQAAGLDRAAERVGVVAVLERSGLGRSLAALIARAVRIGLALLVIFAAVSLLGLQFLSPSLNQAILALPKLFIAALLVLAGAVLAGSHSGSCPRISVQVGRP